MFRTVDMKTVAFTILWIALVAGAMFVIAFAGHV
jgi:hypothetical protein